MFQIKQFQSGKRENVCPTTLYLKAKKKLIIGFILLVMGGVILALSQICVGTDIQDFLSGVMLGLSIGEVLAGFFLLSYYLAYKNKRK